MLLSDLGGGLVGSDWVSAGQDDMSSLPGHVECSLEAWRKGMGGGGGQDWYFGMTVWDAVFTFFTTAYQSDASSSCNRQNMDQKLL